MFLTHLSILKNSLFNTALVWKIPTWEFHSLYLVSTPIHYLKSALSNTSVICKFNTCKINLTNVWVWFSSSLFPEHFVQLILPWRWIYRKTLTLSKVWYYTHSVSQHIPWNNEKVNWLLENFLPLLNIQIHHLVPKSVPFKLYHLYTKSSQRPHYQNLFNIILSFTARPPFRHFT